MPRTIVSSHLFRWLGLALSAGLLAGACSAAASQPPAAAGASVAGATSQPATGTAVGTTTANGVGPFLTGAGGRTLYILTKDSAGTTTCTGACATTWPPFTVSGGTAPAAGAGVSGTLGTITRPDGSVQVAYDGMPLYYYQGDSAAGQTNGQGLLGVWFVALASGVASPAASQAAPSASVSSGY